MAPMSRRSPARRLFRLLGVLVLLGGIAGAATLFMLGPHYRDRQIDDLARGAVGCVTPLVFTDTGTYYVFQEVAGPELSAASCPPRPQGDAFAVAITGPDGPVEMLSDRSEAYNANGAVATSLGQIEVTEPGTYRLTVIGPDTAVRAAVGTDPDDIVGEYRTYALVAGIAGAVLGVGLLMAGVVGGKHQSVAPAAPHAPAGTGFAPPPFPSPAAPAAPGVPGGEQPFATPIDPLVPVPDASSEAPRQAWGAPSIDERRG